MLGNGRLEAFCFDGVNRLCHIRGKLRKRVWIGVVRRATPWPSAHSCRSRPGLATLARLVGRATSFCWACVSSRTRKPISSSNTMAVRSPPHPGAALCTPLCVRAALFPWRRRGSQSESLQRASRDGADQCRYGGSGWRGVWRRQLRLRRRTRRHDRPDLSLEESSRRCGLWRYTLC